LALRVVIKFIIDGPSLTLHVLFSPDSFPAFILGVILDFALEAVFAIPFELLSTPEVQNPE
jgi:hypothetical protein